MRGSRGGYGGIGARFGGVGVRKQVRFEEVTDKKKTGNDLER